MSAVRGQSVADIGQQVPPLARYGPTGSESDDAPLARRNGEHRAVRPDQAPVQPPVNEVITRADYAGAVKGELVQLEATPDVEVLSSEWAQLPMQFGERAVDLVSASTTDSLSGRGIDHFFQAAE